MLINLENLFNSYGIKYEDKGHYYRIRCINPAHNDSDPSMGVFKDTCGYNCFGCGAKGSANSLVRHITGKSLTQVFPNAPTGTEFEFQTSAPRIVPEKKIFNYEKEAFESVWNNRTVVKFLKEIRGCSDAFIDYFGLQYVRKAQINESTFYNRVTVPIYENGKLVNIEGRDFTEKSKVKVLYPKLAKSDTIFNFDTIDKTKPVYLVEGIFDLPAVFEYDKNCIALLGASLGRNQIRQLNQLKNLVLIPDNDKAGHALIETMDEELSIDFEIAFLDSHIKDPGKAKLPDIKKAVQSKISVIEYLRQLSKIDDELTFDW